MRVRLQYKPISAKTRYLSISLLHHSLQFVAESDLQDPWEDRLILCFFIFISLSLSFCDSWTQLERQPSSHQYLSFSQTIKSIYFSSVPRLTSPQSRLPFFSYPNPGVWPSIPSAGSSGNTRYMYQVHMTLRDSQSSRRHQHAARESFRRNTKARNIQFVFHTPSAPHTLFSLTQSSSRANISFQTRHTQFRGFD